MACTVLLAIRFECQVKLNDALRNMAIQRQGEEDLLRYALADKAPDVLEPEAPVVLRMSHEAASPGTKVFQTQYPFLYQRAANASSLVLRQDRHRSKSIPVRGPVGNRHRGKGDMSHYAPLHFSYKRDRERLGSTQCGNDELLRLIADGQRLERSGRNLGDGADIVTRFTSDEYLVRHVSEYFS
jgi:hypothetical protein